VPPIYDPAVADEDGAVQTEDGQEMTRRLAREEGILAGVSAGAALWACIDLARRIPRDEHAVIVTVFPDSGDKYLSDKFWSEA
jgi:cysteine synthase B